MAKSGVGINIAFVYSWWLYRIVSGETIPQNDFERHIVGIMIRQSKLRVTRWFSSNKGSQSGSWSEIWWVRSLSHQLLSSEMSCLWENLQKFMWEVQKKLTCQNMFPDFPWKVTIWWHYYHSMYYIHYLKMFCNCCHINRQCILSIPNVFLICQP